MARQIPTCSSSTASAATIFCCSIRYAAIATPIATVRMMKESLTDSLHSLTKKLTKALHDDNRVPDEIAGACLARLDEVRV